MSLRLVMTNASFPERRDDSTEETVWSIMGSRDEDEDVVVAMMSSTSSSTMERVFVPVGPCLVIRWLSCAVVLGT